MFGSACPGTHFPNRTCSLDPRHGTQGSFQIYGGSCGIEDSRENGDAPITDSEVPESPPAA